MLPKAHSTSCSSISGFTWVTETSSLSGSLWPFLYSSSVPSCYFFLISYASLMSLTFLSFIVPIFEWSIPMISPIFLKRSILFTIYYFPLILEFSLTKTFLYLLVILCKSAFHWVYLSLSFCCSLLLFFQLFWRPAQETTLPSHICFCWGWFWLPLPVQFYKPPSIVLQATRTNPLNLFFISLYSHKGFDLGHSLMV